MKNLLLTMPMVLLLACNQAQPPKEVVTDRAGEATVSIEARSDFKLRSTIAFDVTVKSPSAGEVLLEMVTPTDSDIPTKRRLQFQNAGTQSFTLTGELNELGFNSFIVNASSAAWEHETAASKSFVVDEPGALGVSADSALAPGTTTALDNIAKLRQITTPAAYNAYMREVQKQNQNKQPVAERFVIQKDLVFRDGKSETQFTNPVNRIVSFDTKSGSGKPSQSDLEPPVAPANTLAPTGAGCSLGGDAKVQVRMVNAGVTYPLRRVKVSVLDENPWWGDSLISAGYTDNDGNYTFKKPTCDYGAWWDYSGSDLYFVVETVDQKNFEVRSIFGPGGINSLYAVRSGTFWDSPVTTYDFTFQRTSQGYAGTAFWVLTRGQWGLDFAATAGTTAEYQPLRIIYPSNLAGSNNAGSLISKIEFGESFSDSPYPLYHEMGHEALYFINNKWDYLNAYGMGELALPLPIGFDWLHNCHPYLGGTGCAENHMWNDGFADFFDLGFRFSNNSTTYRFYPGSAACGFTGGNQKIEARVTDFLFDYITIGLATSVTPVGSYATMSPAEYKIRYGKIRDAINSYANLDTSLKEVFNTRIKNTMLAGRSVMVQNIASYSCMQGLTP